MISIYSSSSFFSSSPFSLPLSLSSFSSSDSLNTLKESASSYESLVRRFNYSEVEEFLPLWAKDWFVFSSTEAKMTPRETEWMEFDLTKAPVYALKPPNDTIQTQSN